MRPHLMLGDITTVSADAIVNAANTQLLPGGGVCGAIHAAAGPGLAIACAEHVNHHGPVPPGSAAITAGFELPARYVIHAVGPVWHGGTQGEPELLASAFRTSVELAVAKGLESIAFPSISTGIYGYPIERAAPIAVEAVNAATELMDRAIDVTFVLFDEVTYSAFCSAVDAP